MFESIANFFKKLVKTEKKEAQSKDMAKERLHLVLMQDRANVSADFLELMKQEIIDVIKKYIEVEESAIDVRLTNEIAEDGQKGAPSLYANIPIKNIKNDITKEKVLEDKGNTSKEAEPKKEEQKDDIKDDKVENSENKEEKKEDNKKEQKETKQQAEEEKKESKEEVKPDNLEKQKINEQEGKEDINPENKKNENTKEENDNKNRKKSK